MEHKTLPIKIFTYNLEFPQFVFADRNKVSTDPLDHTNTTRAHCEFVANAMANMGKLST